MSDIPNQPGTYRLLWQVLQSTRVQVGRLGELELACGYYAYIGSAYGPGGLRARINHHLREHHPRPHWHLDYLRPHWHAVAQHWHVQQRCECAWAQQLLAAGAIPIAPRFGASDCNCAGHGLYLPAALAHSLLN